MKKISKKNKAVFTILFTVAQIFFCVVILAAFSRTDFGLWQKLAVMLAFGGLYFFNLMTSARRISLHTALSASVLGSFLSLGILLL